MLWSPALFYFFFFNDTATTEIYTLSLHDALPISARPRVAACPRCARVPRARQANGSRLCRRRRLLGYSSVLGARQRPARQRRSEEHTSELQSQSNLVCRLLLEKKIIKFDAQFRSSL